MAEISTLSISGTSEPTDLSGPNIKSSDFLAMDDYWTMVRTILDGSQAIRDAGEKYLPRYQNEKITQDSDGVSYDPYTVRRQHAPFTNIYDDVSKNLASKPFSKELAMAEGTPEQFLTLAENIDGQGNNLHTFAQTVFRSGIDYAISWILVDYTQATPRADGRPLSRVEEDAQGLRPYWVYIPCDALLAVYSDFIGGVEIITHARIYEPNRVLRGYIESRVERVRVLDRPPIAYDAAGKPSEYGPATWSLWEMVINASTGVGAWVLIEQGVYTIGIIPLVPFITGTRKGTTFQFVPPLRTVAYMQIQEYQQESNLKSIMEMTCFPMLTGVGVPVPETGAPSVPVGPRAVLYGGSTPDGRPGKWEYIEPNGSSVKIVMDELSKTQNDMRDLGMQPLTQSNLTVITTGQVAVKANSAVQAWTIIFKDCLEQCWKITAQWLGQTIEPEVVIHTDFAAIMTDGSQMTTLQAMRVNKDLSRHSLLEAAMRFDYLPSDFDLEKNDEDLLEEQYTTMNLIPEAPIDPRTGQPLVTAAQRQQQLDQQAQQNNPQNNPQNNQQQKPTIQ